ncbi:MAG: hypothetical protein GTO46_02640 [Gemmatimonadetes bacterium]|nr:hypothetical protein [Gemmatimonadota bacterium]NIO30679.1 hypothetical protein [Gemmatimonadota bacterium]
MILTTLLRPPGAPPEKEAGRAVGPDRRVMPQMRARVRRHERAVAVGLIVSVLIHVLFVRLSPLIIRYLEPNVVYYVPTPIVVPEQGMRVIDLVEVEGPVVEPVPEPEPQETPTVEEVEPTPYVSAAERLRPRVGDWRLWLVPPIMRRTNLTEAERLAEVRARLYAILEAYDDSMAAELARELERLDWTIGEEGEEWGISPGKIHLGGITLPLPLYLGLDPAEARRRQGSIDEWNAIQRQAGQGAIDDLFDERIRAIRERKAREEAGRAAKKDTTGAN